MSGDRGSRDDRDFRRGGSRPGDSGSGRPAGDRYRGGDGERRGYRGGESGRFGDRPRDDRRSGPGTYRRPEGERADRGGYRPDGPRYGRGDQGTSRYGDDRPARRPFADDRGGARPPYGDRYDRGGDRRPYGDRDDRRGGTGNGDRRPYRDAGGRPERRFGAGDDRREGRGGYGDRPPYRRDGDDRPARRPYDRDDRREPAGDRRPYRRDGDDRPARRPFDRDDRGSSGDRRPYRGDGDERRPYRRDDDRSPYRRDDDRRPYPRDGDDRPARRPFDRDDRGSSGDRRPYRRDDAARPVGRSDERDRGGYTDRAPYRRGGDDRPARRPVDRDDRGPTGDRRPGWRPDTRSGDHRARDDRPYRRADDGRDRPARSFDRADRPSYDRGSRFGGRDDRAGGRDRGPDDRRPVRGDEERPTGTRIPEPVLHEEVSASDLDAGVRQDLRGLQKDTAETVARHLVAAGSLVDDDPRQALEHARYARYRASRIASVREAAGIAAYHAGEWTEALAELRAARRMGGGPGHVAVMADIERALGRPERAIELSRGPEAAELDRAAAVELAIVAAGARRDLGELDAAVVGLQRAELDPARREPWSARLFYAYADNLLAVGRQDEAERWFLHAADADEDGSTDAAARLAQLTGEPVPDDDADDVVFGEEDLVPAPVDDARTVAAEPVGHDADAAVDDAAVDDAAVDDTAADANAGDADAGEAPSSVADPVSADTAGSDPTEPVAGEGPDGEDPDGESPDGGSAEETLAPTGHDDERTTDDEPANGDAHGEER